MELNKINDKGRWDGTATSLNDNFAKVNAELEKLKAANIKFKGFFSSTTTLSVAHPRPTVGDTAWVGNTYPGMVYECKSAGVWANTNKAPVTPSVELTDYAKTELLDKRTTEYNVSVQHPSSGIDGTNKFTLALAIALVPSPLRTVGIKCSFLNDAGKMETWEYQGGTFTATSSWAQGGARKVAELDLMARITDNSLCLYGNLVFTNKPDGTLSISLEGDLSIFCRDKYIGRPSGTADAKTNSYFAVFVNRKTLELKAEKFSNMDLKTDDIILCWAHCGVKFTVENIIYCASSGITIDGDKYSNRINSETLNIVENKLSVFMALRNPLYIDTTDTGIVVSTNTNFVFLKNTQFQLEKSSVELLDSDYYAIYTTEINKTIQAVKFNKTKELPKGVFILMLVHKPTLDVLYSAANNIYIDGILCKKIDNKSILKLDPIISDIQRLERYRSAFIFNPENAISINITGTNINMTIKGFIQMFFSGSVAGSVNNGYLGFDADQTIDFETIGKPKDYVRLFLDVDNKHFVLKPYSSFTDYEFKKYLYIGMFYIKTNYVKAYLQSGQTYLVNGTKVKGDGTGYNPKGSIDDKTALKYAQIGDSITYLYDNKYETSYGENTSKTGYKGWGYGRLLCSFLGIPYENHYPQGANGRTFCDYYDEWEAGHWLFPAGIQVWTIFLGTNDWGTNRHKLGTQDDYISNTYSSTNRTTYGAIRKIIDKIRGLNNGKVTPRIIFMTPMQRGAFAYGSPLGNFVKSAILKNGNGEWEYTKNNYGFTLKDVADAIAWVCNYEKLKLIDLFYDSIVDINYLNMAQSLDEIGESNVVYQDTLYDNLHPTQDVGIKKISGRLIRECMFEFYDILDKYKR